ncbi:MAG: hypothetical protein AB1721_01645 [Patescibacteria group bacterium]
MKFNFYKKPVRESFDTEKAIRKSESSPETIAYLQAEIQRIRQELQALQARLGVLRQNSESGKAEAQLGTGRAIHSLESQIQTKQQELRGAQNHLAKA